MASQRSTRVNSGPAMPYTREQQPHNALHV